MNIDPRLLKPRATHLGPAWNLWEKKNFNIHRGLIEWTPEPSVASMEQIATTIRQTVKQEFRPGWLRGFGFGAIVHLASIPNDLPAIIKFVDKRNKAGGVWQWLVLCFDNEKVALGVHTWLQGYLRPVYDSLLQQFETLGYRCDSTDVEIDALQAHLQKIAKYGRAFHLAAGLIS